MFRWQFLRQFLLRATVGGVLCLGSCKAPGTMPPSPMDSRSEATIPITLSAAASLQDVLIPLEAAYQDLEPAVEITYNFGSSGSLAQQIIQGAPVDVFLSASPEWLDTLETQGHLLQNSRQALVNNSMVLVVPHDPQGQTVNGQTVTGFQDLSRAHRIAMGEPESVPAGAYAQEVLMTLNLYEGLKPKLVFGKSVRHVLAYVETGNVDAGLVYGTDALISQRVEVVATAPDHSHSAITYGAAVVNGRAQTAAAQDLVRFLGSAAALDIFEQHGFVAVESDG
ncbi:molybdate ABC transporter substrate-binding protein [Leptothoe sp. PORK10 BA2]|uniref:molybdate ABC transporter substrate-binding protein n=1 Tax=Leptothoe sp. PORK10 BA2 TaxID=3110254 RepID=UPI002B20B898|nr:molybdate ABC transporter substrate-binding protein [Leptothoe sp. PORK10 BA2]MEA5466294.1 molybdate ABC transporter substrate-binding protein [Leptothoe sp. PORK10 BA2]